MAPLNSNLPFYRTLKFTVLRLLSCSVYWSVLIFDRHVFRCIFEAEPYFQVYEGATESFFYRVAIQITTGFHVVLALL